MELLLLASVCLNAVLGFAFLLANHEAKFERQWRREEEAEREKWFEIARTR